MKIDNAKLRKEYINQLKNENAVGSRVEVNDADGYRIWIVSRGQELFYHSGDRAFLCDFDPYASGVMVSSIRKWDDGTQVSQEDKDLFVKRLKSYFLRYQDGKEVKLG